MKFEKEIANRLIKIMDVKKLYSQEKKAILVYGMELILDSAIKLIVYLIIGAAFGKFKEVLFAVSIFGIIRKFAGGIHAKTGMGCFFLTGMVITVSIISPRLLSENRVILCVFIWIINVLYFVFAPCDEYFELEGRKKYYTAKGEVMILINIFLIIFRSMDFYWRTIGMAAMLVEGMTLIRRRKVKCEKK